MDISDHQIWKKVSPYKKPFHLARIKIARQYAKLFDRKMFIGITGTVGKTATTEASFAVLSQKYKTLATVANLDSVFNIPITLLKIRPKIKKVIFEMGIEYPGEMDFYLSLIRPKTVIVTKLSYQHSEFLGGLEQIISEKGKLVKQLPKDGIAILNADDINSAKLAEECPGQVVFFGTDSKKAVIWADNIRIENYRTVFQLNYGVERVEVNYALLGFHQVYSALAAAALGVVEDISLIKIKKGLEQAEPAEHRMQVVQGQNGSIIIDDTYNAAPVSVEAAISTLMQVPARRRILVLGETRELGEYSENLHREIAKAISKEKPDMVLLGQGDAKYIADELISLGFWEERLLYDLQNSQIVSHLLKMLGKGDVCLIKGSHAVRLDEVVKRVTKAR